MKLDPAMKDHLREAKQSQTRQWLGNLVIGRAMTRHSLSITCQSEIAFGGGRILAVARCTNFDPCREGDGWP